MRKLKRVALKGAWEKWKGKQEKNFSDSGKNSRRSRVDGDRQDDFRVGSAQLEIYSGSSFQLWEGRELLACVLLSSLVPLQ